MFRRSRIPEPPPALSELELLAALVTAETEPAPEDDRPLSLSDVVEILNEPAGLEPLPEPEPAKPIPGLTIGRVVHVQRDHRVRAGTVAEVHDVCTGDVTVFVYEPAAPSGTARFTYAGDGAELSQDTWQWPPRA